MRYLYLHGFASSPRSAKGRYLTERFAEQGMILSSPDLNRPAFEALTLSSQLAVVEESLADSDGPFTLLGSSLGGLLAVLTAIRDPRITRLVLMAPAFGFVERWRRRLGEPRLTDWRETGKMPVFHYGYGAERLLGPAILDDARRYDEQQLTRPVPTLILHGTHDDIVEPFTSVAFARERPWVTLRFFDADHGMTGVLDQLWQETAAFCGF